jgi:hypothetical protein
LNKVLAYSRLLFLWDLFPVFLYQSSGLDRGLLPDTEVAICGCDLQQPEERLWAGVVVFLEFGSNGLDPLGVGCKKELSVRTQTWSTSVSGTWGRQGNSRTWLSLSRAASDWELMIARCAEINRRGYQEERR